MESDSPHFWYSIIRYSMWIYIMNIIILAHRMEHLLNNMLVSNDMGSIKSPWKPKVKVQTIIGDYVSSRD